MCAQASILTLVASIQVPPSVRSSAMPHARAYTARLVKPHIGWLTTQNICHVTIMLISTVNRIVIYIRNIWRTTRVTPLTMRDEGRHYIRGAGSAPALLPRYGTVGVPMAGNGVPAASEFANVIVSVPSGVRRSTGGLSIV